MSTTQSSDIEKLTVNTLRFLATDMVQKANSGHPGLPLGAAPMAYVVWQRFLRFDSKEPKWPNRDRFVLSAGHGSALLYALLHVYGYDLPMDQLKQFRQLGSKTPGHPESTHTPGVEVTTGPLGQGFGNGVGMAMAEAFLGAKYNQEGADLIDNYIYGIVSDGDLMEGVASEAASLAGHLKLGKLIYLYDDNKISLDGPTDLAFTEDVAERFRAYGWQTLTVEDGNDLLAIEKAILEAQQEKEKPTLISVKTIIGYGSPQQGTNKVHGSALGEENLKKTKEFFGWDPEKTFFIPDGVKEHAAEAIDKGTKLHEEWKGQFASYQQKYPELAQNFSTGQDGKLPEGWDANLPTFKVGDQLATRQASGEALKALRANIPWLLGGSADLASSTETPGKDGSDSFQPGNYGGRNLWFGVREHGMGAILNGMASYGGVRPYGGTFLTFSDYMRGSIRLSALTHAPVTFVFTHDSIALGEDGPTHQPVEQVTSLRLTPNLTVVRPADAYETVEAWKIALGRLHGPVALILSRQKLPVIDQEKYAPATNTWKGAYVLSEAKGGTPDIILMATGSEVHLVLEAQDQLAAEGINARVVSMPSMELFMQQEESYRNEVLLPNVRKRLAVEAGVTLPWYKFITDEGAIIGIDSFGDSGEGNAVLAHFGFTTENVVKKAKEILNK
ncbi:transketolase [Mucilaginibacter sp. RS28]|uniref:Transketolase n=1 Tax=Mucilaginibacter straminoryzae TaxID=2932774 RepID=A0A9X1X383_9SPHI|nr:transketolase [Mucilaginibacter straminoryzae]MCJ8209230.1 transketolase [Mucilaginibacter straminoryzae]